MIKTLLKFTKANAAVAVAVAVAVLGAAVYTSAFAQSSFRQTFEQSYKDQNFSYLSIIIRQNKEKIPAEVDSIVDEATREGVPFGERMHLLDLAVTMATMHEHWNKDPEPLKKAEAVQRKYVEEEKARRAEREKWRSYELVLGNWVMMENKEQMEAEEIPYVLYPHWMHQIFFECRVCHTGIFVPKRGANDINKDKILDGKLCGECHDGSYAFNAKDSCERCHMVGTPREEKFRDVEKVDMEKIQKAADRLGVEWHPDRLPDGKIPVGKFKFVDWTKMNELEVYDSIAKVEGVSEPATKTHDSKILYPSPYSFVKDAVFDHAVHTPRMLCEHCHPIVFDRKLSKEKIKMSEMAAGAACGYCHGKTAFKLADCNRCHTREHGKEPDKGMLVAPKED